MEVKCDAAEQPDGSKRRDGRSKDLPGTEYTSDWAVDCLKGMQGCGWLVLGWWYRLERRQLLRTAWLFVAQRACEKSSVDGGRFGERFVSKMHTFACLCHLWTAGFKSFTLRKANMFPNSFSSQFELHFHLYLNLNFAEV